ncbi:hypothetical protein LCI18_007136 [Fusarium solani-melongenae]|uniref:Uncharacterized protein n=1 Tax=Fusarium solani subsp. cucurbitae TaxID=2747967 RepID=A0ACD3Z5S7_FUSSC|nr:hypothetical protein LCI18_007136 [Fusarium solani-melongenae]
MSGVLGTEAYKQYFDNPKSYRQGAITASMPAGSLVGSLFSSFLADRYSRRVALQISCCASQNIGMLCTGRVVAGFCVGIASAVVPVYQSSLQQWAITWGILIQYFIQYGAAAGIDGGPDDKNQSTAAFRIPWGVQMIPAWILLVGLFFFPSSPRWLASQDKWEEALQTLANLHGKGDKTHPTVLAQYREIEDSLRFDREEAANSYKNLVTRRMLKRVILGMSIQAWSQLCGMNIMMYYIVYIMEGANIASPLLTASIQYIINVLLTLPAILYLDKFGRRALQQHYGQPQDDPDSDVSWVVKDNRPVSSAIVACSYLFVATFATTWGPTSWTYPAEIYPSQIRAKAVSISTSTNWFWNMVLAFAVPPLLNAAAFIHMFLTAHETKGFTLEEMDDVFDSGHPAWKKHNKVSRLENLAKDIEKGKVTVVAPGTGEAVEVGKDEKI